MTDEVRRALLAAGKETVVDTALALYFLAHNLAVGCALVGTEARGYNRGYDDGWREAHADAGARESRVAHWRQRAEAAERASASPAGADIVLHVLEGGRARCGLPGVPRDWPRGHRWVRTRDAATCPGCRS